MSANDSEHASSWEHGLARNNVTHPDSCIEQRLVLYCELNPGLLSFRFGGDYAGVDGLNERVEELPTEGMYLSV